MQIGSTSGLSFSGLASGLDTDSIVRQLISLETLPIQNFQVQTGRLQAQKSAYAQFKSQIQSLNTAVSALALPNTFGAFAVTSSDATAVSATSTGSPSPGIYEVTVNRLATTEKLASKAFSDSTSALDLKGDFQINGKTINLEPTDTLTEVAAKINEAGAEVTAKIVNGGSGRSFLTLTSSKSGLAGAIQLTGASGGALTSNSPLAKLGFAASVREGTYSGSDLVQAKSNSLGSSSASLKSLISSLEDRNYTFKVNGTTLTFNPNTASLDDIAAALNGVADVTASIVPDGANKYLDITSSANLEFEDTDGLLQAIGVMKAAEPKLTTAQDAEVVIDGITVTNSTNKLENVIPGLNIDLKKASTDSTIRLEVAGDTDTPTTKMKEIVDKYNAIVKFAKQNSSFDTKTYATGILFADSVSANLQSALNTAVFSSISNLQGQFNNLTQVGVSMTSDGTLSLDETKLKETLTNDPDAVKELLIATGRSSNSEIEFVASGSKSKASSASGYAINVTQLATKSSALAASAQTSANLGGELLTFTGSGLGSNGYQISIAAGTTQNDLVNTINNDSKLKNLFEASIEGGKLKITSKSYGAASAFQVSSNLAAGADNSGIGTDGTAIATNGVDIAGTINGEEAVGNGQFLIGKDTNATTSGVQIRYTGATTGTVGNLVFSRGVAGLFQDISNSYLDAKSGILIASDGSLDAQITDVDNRISRIQQRATVHEAELRAKFVAMEQAMQASQAQLARMQAMLAQS